MWASNLRRKKEKKKKVELLAVLAYRLYFPATCETQGGLTLRRFLPYSIVGLCSTLLRGNFRVASTHISASIAVRDITFG